MADLSVKVADLALKNPLIAASGTFGFGQEMAEFFDISALGAISTKGFTRLPRKGNPAPRVAECDCGMLNAVGLQNPGLEVVLRKELPFMRSANATIIANVAGDTAEDYIYITERLAQEDIGAIELNFSCPNVKEGCITFGSDPQVIESLTAECVKHSPHPIWVKLTPNVTSISDMAKAAEQGGATAVSLINTLLGMVIDIETRKPILRNNTGGYSGPAIKPVALRMISEVYNSVSIPIVGLGGISSAEDVAAFMIAGASAVQIGTGLLVNPSLPWKIMAELPELCRKLKVDRISELTGTLELWT